MAVTARFTEQLVVLVSPTVREQLEDMAERDSVSLGSATRDVLHVGLATLGR